MTRAPRRVSHALVDVEADGPIPGDYSMICSAQLIEPRFVVALVHLRRAANRALRWSVCGSVLIRPKKSVTGDLHQRPIPSGGRLKDYLAHAKRRWTARTFKEAKRVLECEPPTQATNFIVRSLNRLSCGRIRGC